MPAGPRRIADLRQALACALPHASHRAGACALAALATLAMLAPASTSHAANLLVNGNFEASTSNVTTPTGWTNIGWTQGILYYEWIGGIEHFEGTRFYSIGGSASNGWSQVGDGLSQTFATVPGATYHLSFALSAENVSWGGDTTFRASAGDTTQDWLLVPTGGAAFSRPFTVEGFDFTALGTSTTLSLLMAASTSGATGNNDPIFDAVSVELVSLPVPEPSPALLLAGGLAALAAWRRRSPC